MSDHTHVFIGGLHRSGTSLLFRVLRDHPEVSGFRDTGVREDEGQHLQQTFMAARDFGGAGRFAFDPSAHLLEVDAVTASQHRAQLLESWGTHWDLTRPVLLEKSPPNLIRMRYLQSVFPGARFVVIVRHPVTTALATKKWRRTESLSSLIRHWLAAYDLAMEDAKHVESFSLVRYEDLVADPIATLDRVQRFIGVQPDPVLAVNAINPSASDAYSAQWRAASRQPLKKVYTRWLTRRFGRDVARYGYVLDAP